MSFPHLGQCSHRVAGLPAGRYEVLVSGGPSGLAATSEFIIEEQQATPVLIEARILRLSGRVLLNGQPFSSPVSLAFERMAEAGRPRGVTVPVEPDGSYSVSFAEPGRYRGRVAASSVVLLGQEKTIDLVEAHTVIDWDLEGGSLRVDAKPATPGSRSARETRSRFASKGSGTTRTLSMANRSILTGAPASPDLRPSP